MSRDLEYWLTLMTEDASNGMMFGCWNVLINSISCKAILSSSLE